MRITVLFFLLLTIYYLVPTTNVFAASEFTTSYDIDYSVDTKGVTTTRQNIILKNLLEHVYATEYSIIIGSNSIADVTASDNFGNITPEVKLEANSTKINLKFDKHIIGKDKARSVIVTYKTPDFATVKGQVLEVGFPLLANSSEMEDYKVTINIPKFFGKATHVIPSPTNESNNNSYSSYVFNKSSIKDQDSISATFGTIQIYKFNLTYNLENPNDVKGRTELALPADTNYQQVIYSSIEPKPEQVTMDGDGNWLASYVLEPKSQMKVLAMGNIKLTYFPNEASAKQLSEEEIATYTKPDEYWESDNSDIQKLSKSLSTPKQIYEYLVNTFEYDYSRLNNNAQRLGAIKAIANPTSNICMEFTDSFIALARAAGIPARELNGFAYTENDRLRPLALEQDVLHAWPEYFDNKSDQWIQIDPTWGKTTGGLNFFDKFDLDHIAFVIHGANSSYPITAGSYKYTGQKTRDVEITFDNKFELVSNYDATINVPPNGITGFMQNGNVKYFNYGNSALYKTPYTISLNHNGSSIQNIKGEINTLPPFGYFQIPLNHLSTWKDKGGIFTYIFSSNNIEKKAQFELSPIINYQILVPLIFVLVFLILLIIYLKLYKHKQRKLKTHTQPVSSRNIIQPNIFKK